MDTTDRRRVNRDKARRYWARNKEKIRKKNREYGKANREASRERSKRYRQTNPERASAATARWKQANSAKVAAHGILNRALRLKLICRGPCEVCGTTIGVQAHHKDYGKPLDVHWLCKLHHEAEHHS